MRRRHYLATMLPLLAGCAQQSPGGSSDPTTTNEPRFEIVETEPSEPINVGEQYRIRVGVKNTGGATGTFSDNLQAKIPSSDGWQDITEIRLEDIEPGNTRTWESGTASPDGAGSAQFRLEERGTAWELTVERVSATPQIETVNLISEWQSFGDVLENEIESATVGETISIGYRFQAVTHDGTSHTYAQVEIVDDDTGERVALRSNEDEQVTQGSGYQTWEYALAFDTTGWDPGTYRAEVMIRDEVEKDVSDPASTTFEVMPSQ